MNDAAVEAEALTLVEQALDLPPGERDGYLSATAATPEAQSRARAILSAESIAAAFHTGGLAAFAGADAPLPERIGAYRITGRIGQGGMGAVYRGERDRGDFDHAAAIKVIRPGALSDALIERFTRERQTLARLSHPGIARLFDGGETPAGDPYIVMELVEGRPLSEWLEAAERPLVQRLRLFLEVCAAVAFAHASLVIHRDITPANILVTADGAPKLIDFGIARPVMEEAGPAPAVTLTPGYAAPERLRGGAADTRADIFSLGKVLGVLAGTGAQRDLAAIVARAAAADPVDRYGTVDALAADLRAYLGGRPVAARAGGRGYVWARFVLRNRAAVTAAGGALALLLVAFALTALSLARAERARAAEAARFTELRSLAGFMLFDLNDRLRRVPGNTTARARLAEEAQSYLSRLAAEPGAPAGLRAETARGLIRLAEIQGTPMQRNLGDAARARANLRAADAMLVALGAENGGAHGAALARARVHQAMIALYEDRDGKTAATMLARAEAPLARMVPEERGAEWREAEREARRARLELGVMNEDMPALLRTVAEVEAAVAAVPAATRGPDEAEELAYAAYHRGVAGSSAGKGDFGLAHFQRAVALFGVAERARPNDPQLLYMTAWAANDGFASAAQAGQAAVSTALLERARAAVTRLRAIEDRDQSVLTLAKSVEEGWAQELSNRGRHVEAIAAQQQVIGWERARLAKAGSKGGADLGWNHMILGTIAKQADDRALTCAAWRQAALLYAAAKRQGKLMGFYAAFVPGIERNLGLCAAGRPLAAFGPLR